MWTNLWNFYSQQLPLVLSIPRALKTEGAFYQNAIATYSHGPLLPKNPFVADWLIQTALRLKYQQPISLKPLDDTLAMQARDAMFKRLKVNPPTAVTAIKAESPQS
jgi:lipid II isoglutaminyl synthase (glutamine-hydrolysing)